MHNICSAFTFIGIASYFLGIAHKYLSIAKCWIISNIAHIYYWNAILVNTLHSKNHFLKVLNAGYWFKIYIVYVRNSLALIWKFILKNKYDIFFYFFLHECNNIVHTIFCQSELNFWQRLDQTGVQSLIFKIRFPFCFALDSSLWLSEKNYHVFPKYTNLIKYHFTHAVHTNIPDIN